MELFKLSPEELSEICIKAEFDENDQLIINEENCVHKGNLIFFKKPIYIKFDVLQMSIMLVVKNIIVGMSEKEVLVFCKN